MTTTTNIPQLKFNKLTESQYEGTTPVEGEFYLTPEADYALNADVVHKTGDETITGQKTLTASNIITNHTHIRNESVEQLTVPSGYSERMIHATDMNGVRIGSLGFAITADGSSRTYIESSKNINGEQTYGIIESYTDLNGNHSYYIGGNLVKAFVRESWKSGASWYRVWSDGWIEQGGRASLNECSSTAYTLHKPFSDTNYYVTVCQYNVSTAGDTEMGVGASPTSTTQFNAFCHYINPNTMNFMWYACGY